MLSDFCCKICSKLVESYFMINPGRSPGGTLKKNRLYLKMAGEMSKRELEKLYTEVRFCVADLQPSFNVIADYIR